MSDDHDLARIIEPLARYLLGEPNRALSSKRELRFGAHGSLSVDLAKGTWYDHEINTGGGVLKLVEREKGLRGKDAVRWLESEHFVDPAPPKPKPNGDGRKGRIVATYDYVDACGALVFQAVRYEPKRFSQRRPDGKDWAWNLDGVKRVPYRLPELVEALSQEHVIFIVEGEKDVDRLRSLNVPATCNSEGAGAWKPEHSAWFERSDADIVIVPDHDPQAIDKKTGALRFYADGRPIFPGQDHAQAVARALKPIAKRVRVLDLAEIWPEIGPKGDISDWLDAGHTVEDLNAAIAELRDWTPGNGVDHEPPDRGEPQTVAPEPRSLAQVVEVFRRWLALKDELPIYVTLGTVAANLLAGDPVWVGLIAPPSSAKTELLNSIGAISYVRTVETFTPAALLSGTATKERAKFATGGVLREIGGFGVLLFKDFGSVLDLRQEQRAEMMTALRRIYDGEYTRHIGVEGGRSLVWRGKAGAIFGGTQAYDSHHAVSGTLGDRFLLYRVEAQMEEQLDKCRLQSGSNAKRMREEIARAVAGLFAALPRILPEPALMTDAEYATLRATIPVVIRLRAGVPRDRQHEIIDVHDPEGPARLTKALQQLFAGLVLIGVSREDAVKLIVAVAHDSAPKIRVKTYRALTKDWQTLRQIAAKIKYPPITTRRALEELTAQDLALLRDAAEDPDADQPDMYESSTKKRAPAGAYQWKLAP